MTTEWLSAQSFERNQQLLSAINTLSINAKLRQLGADDSARREAVERAQNDLINFVEAMEPIVHEVKADEDQIAVSADPRLNDLALNLASSRYKGKKASSLGVATPADLKQLLLSTDVHDIAKLVSYLRELRKVIEQHTHVDVVNMLGEM
jgi:hypothetical protein